MRGGSPYLSRIYEFDYITYRQSMRSNPLKKGSPIPCIPCNIADIVRNLTLKKIDANSGSE